MFPYSNDAERDFTELATQRGWSFTKRGWPDFWCVDEIGPFAVEVKPRTKTGRMKRLQKDQFACMAFLVSHGIRCFVSDGYTLVPFIPASEEAA